MRKPWRLLSPASLGTVVYGIVATLGRTLRIETSFDPEAESLQGPRIYAGWHGRTLIAAQYFRGQGVWTIISQSRDGETQNRVFTKFGFRTIRGSSGRDGLRAALEAIRVLRTGESMAFTPDGPRGPSGVVQPGIVAMAQKSGAPIVPVGVSARRRWFVRSWDRYMVPKPFSRCLMCFGAPIRVQARATPDEFEAARLEVERRLTELECEAERRMGHGGDHSPL